MDWSADVNISGTLASVGARLIEGTAQKLIGQTFTCIKTKLQDEVVSAPPAPAPAGATAAAAGPAAAAARPRTQPPLPPPPSAAAPGAPDPAAPARDRTTNRGSARREECRRRGRGSPAAPAAATAAARTTRPARPCRVPDPHRRPDDDERLRHRRPGDPRGSRDRHGAAVPRVAGGRARGPQLEPEADRHHPRPLGSHRRGSRGPAVVRRAAAPPGRPSPRTPSSATASTRRAPRTAPFEIAPVVADGRPQRWRSHRLRRDRPRGPAHARPHATVRSVCSPGRVASSSAATRCSAAAWGRTDLPGGSPTQMVESLRRLAGCPITSGSSRVTAGRRPSDGSGRGWISSPMRVA